MTEGGAVPYEGRNMVKLVEANERWCVTCYARGRVVRAAARWKGRYYCSKHNPAPVQPEKPKRERTAAEAARRSRNNEAVKRHREKRKREHAERVALQASKGNGESAGSEFDWERFK